MINNKTIKIDIVNEIHHLFFPFLIKKIALYKKKRNYPIDEKLITNPNRCLKEKAGVYNAGLNC
jgi:hypothetical protein